eukprot:8818488-Alexandrium_andersonii.AAC.1
MLAVPRSPVPPLARPASEMPAKARPQAPAAVPQTPQPPPGPLPQHLYADASRADETRREDLPLPPSSVLQDSASAQASSQDGREGPLTVHTA